MQFWLFYSYLHLKLRVRGWYVIFYSAIFSMNNGTFERAYFLQCGKSCMMVKLDPATTYLGNNIKKTETYEVKYMSICCPPILWRQLPEVTLVYILYNFLNINNFPFKRCTVSLIIAHLLNVALFSPYG